MQTGNPQATTNRMLRRQGETDPINPDAVEKRAVQIAGKDGRGPSDVTDFDRTLAWRELEDELGAAPPSRDQLEQRARENAAIAGRRPGEATEGDRQTAWNELHDADVVPPGEGPPAHHSAARDPAEPVVRTDHARPRKKAPDEAVLETVEVQEGLREAEHEKELRASRQQREEA